MKQKNKKIIWLLCIFIIIAFACICIFVKKPAKNPEDTFKKYMSCILNKNYEEMYEMLSNESKQKTDKETYIARNKNIYEGIELSNLEINIVKTNKIENKIEVIYNTSMQTIAGEINFSNTSYLIKENEDTYKIDWSSTDIFPELKDEYKVRVEELEAERGKILDRNGNILAGKQTASQVGLVPGKINEETKEQDIAKVAELLDLSVNTIKNSLLASYVKEDTFVPLRTVRKSEQELKNKLLEIKGIKIIDVEERIYPLGEEASHLVGYVQSISKEELEQKEKDGYDENSIIGKSGLEKIYEERLRAINGAEIYIVNSDGNKIKTIAKKEAKNGENIKLTIDSNLQTELYTKFKEDKSAHVAINPKTGEVLALVSTPSFDSNDFSLGMTTNKWNTLSQDEAKPLYNRYLSSFTPGSSIKPIIGAIGLNLGAFTADEDFGTSTNKWQKDSSWGDFYITTLTTYKEKSNLENALVYSDNIYFAKAALKIGKENLAKSLEELGFKQKIEFVQDMDKSSYSNTDNISSEKQLANTGYGQAEMLVNPIHMAMIYSSFQNEGDIIMPYLEYKENANITYYKKQAFSKEVANTIKQDLIQVVESPNGTANTVKIEGLKIAGKTGTAEIKASKDDNTGTEIGWFNSFLVDENSNKQLLIVSMVEDVKGRGGSHYLLEKIKEIYQNI